VGHCPYIELSGASYRIGIETLKATLSDHAGRPESRYRHAACHGQRLRLKIPLRTNVP